VNILVDIPNEINRQTTTVKPGQRRLIGSLVCAALAFTVAPVMFGRLGVVARTVSVWKGANWTIAPRAFCRRPSNGLTSPPGLFRLLKVPRTIAELEGAEGINIAQLAEALQYRLSTAGS